MSPSNHPVRTAVLAWFALAVAVQTASAAGVRSDDRRAAMRERALTTLTDALGNESGSVKTLAAESLLWNGYPEPVRRVFGTEAATRTGSAIDESRVQARLRANNRAARLALLDRIRRAAVDAGNPERAKAIEALAVLHDPEPPPEIRSLANTGDGVLQVYARWVLADSGDAQDQQALANLLASPRPDVRSATAFAILHLKKVRPETVRLLEQVFDKEPPASPARASIAAALYAHVPAARRAAYDSALRQSAESEDPGNRATAAAAWAARGTDPDLSLLEEMLNDPAPVVRVAAANAVLRIDRRHARGLRTPDWIIIGGYAFAMLAIGWYYSRKTKTTEDYLLGGRTMKSGSIGLSLFATLMSTITYLALPGEMLKNGPTILWNLVCLPIVFVVVAYVLIPYFMRLRLTSAYELLQGRFGVQVRLLASAIFLFTRLAWMGLIVYATAKMLVLMMNWPESWIVYVSIIMGFITIVYTSMGGLRAVVLTDVIQSFILFGGAILSIVLITIRMGGVGAWWPSEWEPHWGSQSFFSFKPGVRVTVIGSMVWMLLWWICTAGSDQVAIQRYFATRDAKAARRAFGITLGANVLTTSVLAILGFALLGFFGKNPHFLGDGQSFTGETDFIFPQYIVNFLPLGFAGLVVSGVFAAAMSSLSAGVNSCCSVFKVDFLDRFRSSSPAKGQDEGGDEPLSRQAARMGTGTANPQSATPNPRPADPEAAGHVGLVKVVSLVIGILVVLLGTVMDRVPGNLIEVTTRTNHLFVAPLFGLFFMAMFVPFATTFGTIWGAIYGVAAAVVVAFWDAIIGPPTLSFQWITLFSLSANLIAGCLLSLAPTRGKPWPVKLAWSAVAAAPLVAAFVCIHRVAGG